MERQRQNTRWNTAQFLRSIEESHFGEDRRHVESNNNSSSHGRSLVSRLGMSELSCFPSSRSRRAPDMQQQQQLENSRRRSSTIPQTRTVRSSQLRPDHVRRIPATAPPSSNKGKSRVFPRTSRPGVNIRNNMMSSIDSRGENMDSIDSEDQVFELALMDEEAPNMHTYRSSSKRKSSARVSTSNMTEQEKKLREESQRAANLRRSSSSALRSSASEGLRPQKVRGRRSAEVNSRAAEARTEYHGLMTCHLEQQQEEAPQSIRRPTRSRVQEGNQGLASSSRSRPSTTYTASASSSRYRLEGTGGNRSLASGSRNDNDMFARRNISNCFPSLGSQGRRSSSPLQAQAAAPESGTDFDLPPSSSTSSVPFLTAALERMPSMSRAAASSSSADNNISWPSSSTSFGWEYHRPRLMAEGLAKILMALERVETDEDLTHEQLLMLEATVLFGGMGLHDQHHAWRMDVDRMSYEELLALEEKMGVVNTGLDQKTISTKMFKSNYTVKSVRSRSRLKMEDFDIKCSICQEEYEKNDQLGWLDCGHQYHAECIKEWLVLKNVCPICKSTGLSK